MPDDKNKKKDGISDYFDGLSLDGESDKKDDLKLMKPDLTSKQSSTKMDTPEIEKSEDFLVSEYFDKLGFDVPPDKKKEVFEPVQIGTEYYTPEQFSQYLEDKKTTSDFQLNPKEIQNTMQELGHNVEKEGIALEEQRKEPRKDQIYPDLPYWFTKGYNESIIGLSQNIIQGEAAFDLDKYEPEFWDEVGAGIFSLVLDMPAFIVTGGIGGIAGKTAVRGAMKYGVGVFAKKGVTSLTKKSLLNYGTKSVEKLVGKGIAREVAERKVQQQLAKTLAKSEVVGKSIGANSIALGSYSAGKELLGQLADGRTWEDIRWGEVANEGYIGGALGLGLGVLSSASYFFTQAMKAAPMSAPMSAKAYKYVVDPALKVGTFGLENAIFVAGDKGLRGQPLSSITWKEIVASITTLGALKAGHISPSKLFGKAESFRGKSDANKGIFKTQFDKAELDALGLKNTDDVFFKLGSDKKLLASKLADPKIPLATKEKILWGLEGIRVNVDADIAKVEVKETDGEYGVAVYDSKGELVDVKSYGEDGVMAKKDAFALTQIAMDNQNRANLRKLSSDQDMDVLNEVNRTGLDRKLLDAGLETIPSQRTPDQAKEVTKFYDIVRKVTTEGEAGPVKETKKAVEKPVEKEVEAEVKPVEVKKEVEVKPEEKKVEVKEEVAVKPEVKPKEITPEKKVSVSRAKSLEEVREKSHGDLGKMESSMLDSKFRKTDEVFVEEPESLTGKTLDKLEDKGYVEYNSSNNSYKITEEGREFIDKVNARQETRKGVKDGTDLFPETAAIPELKPKPKVEQPKTEKPKAEKPKVEKERGITIKEIEKPKTEKPKAEKPKVEKERGITIKEIEKKLTKQKETPKTPEQLLKDAKTIEDLQTLQAERKVPVDRAFNNRMEEIRVEGKKKKADDKIASGFNKLADLSKARKFAVAEGEPNPLKIKDVYDAIKDIIEGYVMKGHLSAEQILKKVKGDVSKYGITPEHVDQYKETLTELVGEQKRRRDVLKKVDGLREKISGIQEGQKDIGKYVKEVISHIKKNKDIFTKTDYNKILNIVKDIAGQPKKRGAKGEPLTKKTLNEYLKEAFDVIESAEKKHEDVLAKEAKLNIIEKEASAVVKALTGIKKEIKKYKLSTKKGVKTSEISGYVRSATSILNEFKSLKEGERSTAKDLEEYGYTKEQAEMEAKRQYEDDFFEYLDNRKDAIDKKIREASAKDVGKFIYEDIALRDMRDMYDLDSKGLENTLGNIKRTIKEGKTKDAEARIEREKEHIKFRDESIKEVKKAVGGEYFRAANPKRNRRNPGMDFYANMFHTRAWLGWMGVELGTAKKGRTLWTDPLNRRFHEGEDGIMQAETTQETLRREHVAWGDGIGKMFGKTKAIRDRNMQKLYDRKTTDAEVVNADGTTEKIKASKVEAMGILFQLRDPSTHESFFMPIDKSSGRQKGMGFTEETVKRLEEYVGEKGIAVIDKMQDKVPYWGGKADAIYQPLNGVSMMVNENFMPTSRKKMVADEVSVKGDKFDRPTAMGDHFNQRKGAIGTYDYIDVFKLYNDYVNEMIDYTSFAKTFKKWNSVFGNPEVRTGIKNRYGNRYAEMWKFYLNNLTGNANVQIGGIVDRVARGVQKGALYYGPMVPAKQLVSTMYWLSSLDPKQSAVFTKDVPLIAAEVTASKAGKVAGKDISTVGSEIFDVLDNSSLVKLRKEGRGTILSSDFDIQKAGFKFTDGDSKKFLDLYHKFKQENIKPYSRRAVEFNDFIGGSMIGLADRMPVTVGGSAYFKIRYKELAGRNLTKKDIKKFRDGNPDESFKQTLKDWESLAESTQQTTRKSNQAYARVANPATRAAFMFTSSQHQLRLAAMYHRRAAERATGKKDYRAALNHIKGYAIVTVANSLVFSYMNNGFRISSDSAEENEQVVDVAIGMTASGVPGFHQVAEAGKAMYLKKPWGEKFHASPAMSKIESLIVHSGHALELYRDKSKSDESKREASTEVVMDILSLKGINAPKIITLYENWSTMPDQDFPIQAGLGLKTEYLQGKPALDVFENYRDISYKGETKKEFDQRLDYVNSKQGEKFRVELDDPKVIKTYDVIYKASSDGNAWVPNFMKKFYKTMGNLYPKGTNEEKLRYLANIAKDKGKTVTNLLNVMKETYGHRSTDGMITLAKDYDLYSKKSKSIDEAINKAKK